MIRVSCVVAGLLALAPAMRPPDIDAVKFALAFRDGQADQFKNRAVAGMGMSFHGAIKERIGDGSTRTSLVITLGAADRSGQLTMIKTWDDFVAAERAHTTLAVALSGPDLPAPPASGPAEYSFRGVYDGQVRTIVRAPQAGESNTPDSGPCPGEQPRRDADPKASFYCAPLLTGATATVKQ
jgi:hypothetical protein